MLMFRTKFKSGFSFGSLENVVTKPTPQKRWCVLHAAVNMKKMETP